MTRIYIFCCIDVCGRWVESSEDSKEIFIVFKNKNNSMETYNPEEVKKLIQMLNSINAKIKKIKGAEPTRLEKQITYLEQRLKFFNPTKEMLGYIINQAEHSKIKLDPILLEKLKSEFIKKE